jgi:hypothetical protein
MRAFVFLLILANLLFFSWTQGYFDIARDSDAFRVDQQLLADRIRVVARDEPPPEKVAAVASKPPEKKVEDVCLRFVELPLADAVRLENLVAEKFPAMKTARTVNPVSAAYWVFIPPAPTRQETDRKIAELKKLGVPELFVVQEPGPDQRAISLGIFSTREAANERLDELRAKSVRTAKVGERNVKAASATLDLRGPRPESAPAFASLIAETVPDAKPQSCAAQPGTS